MQLKHGLDDDLNVSVLNLQLAMQTPPQTLISWKFHNSFLTEPVIKSILKVGMTCLWSKLYLKISPEKWQKKWWRDFSKCKATEEYERHKIIFNDQYKTSSIYMNFFCYPEKLLEHY